MRTHTCTHRNKLDVASGVVCFDPKWALLVCTFSGDTVRMLGCNILSRFVKQGFLFLFFH
jgi:hypothetical protein